VVRIVVAGFGNVLRRDDGFGVAVVEHLEAGTVPAEVTLMDVGIGGIHLVQVLMEAPADALVILDAVELGRAPGTVVVVEPDVPDVRALTALARRDELADVHYATPDRALMFLRALDLLPAHTVTIGCEPLDPETPEAGLTPSVAAAVAVAAAEVRRHVTSLGVPWSSVAAAT
jgi:hydrogenase maturation protease